MGRKGRPLTPEHRAAISAAKLGKSYVREHREAGGAASHTTLAPTDRVALTQHLSRLDAAADFLHTLLGDRPRRSGTAPDHD